MIFLLGLFGGAFAGLLTGCLLAFAGASDNIDYWKDRATRAERELRHRDRPSVRIVR